MIVILQSFSDYGRPGDRIDLPPNDALALIKSGRAVAAPVADSIENRDAARSVAPLAVRRREEVRRV